MKIRRRELLVGAGAAWFSSYAPALAECTSGDWTVIASKFIGVSSGARKRVQVEPAAGVQATGIVDFTVELNSFILSTNNLLSIGWPKFAYKGVAYDDKAAVQNVRVVAEFDDNRLSRIAQAPNLLSTPIRLSDDELSILKSSTAIACRLLLSGEAVLQCQVALAGLAQALQIADDDLKSGQACP